jgi:hypothetical protein
MQKFFMGLFSALAALALPAAAHAQWMHTEGEDDPFAGGAQHMAMAMTAMGEILGFRCNSVANLSLVYVSIEKPAQEHLSVVGLLKPQLLVIVDSEPVQTFQATMDVTPDGDRYRVVAEDSDLTVLLRQTAAAKKRFAVAVQMGGQRMYSAAVNVRGSRSAISALASGCRLP